MLRTRQLGRVQAAVDVDKSLALFGQVPRFSLGQRFRMRQTPGDFPIAIDLERFALDDTSA